MPGAMSHQTGHGRRVLVLYADTTFWSMGEGGGAGAFSRTPRAMAEHGYEVHLVLPAGNGTSAGVEDFHGVSLHRFRASTNYHPRMGSLVVRLAARLHSYLAYQVDGYRAAMTVARRHPPDVVIAFGAYEVPVARRIARRLGVPNVTRIFGTGLALTMRNPIKYYLNFPEVIAFHTPCARMILTNDGADGERVAQHCRVPRDRFHHLRNGLDFTLFAPGAEAQHVRSRVGAPPGVPLLMTVSRLSYEKKLERLIDAMPAVLARVPRAIAVLVGEGPERPGLEARARQLGVEHALRFPGAVPNAELPAWYRTADVVLSLLDRTNAGNPVFEAMACGRSVVALDVGTARDVVLHDRTGVLLPVSELPRLGDAIADLILDEPRRRRYEAAARPHIRGLLLDPDARMEQEIEILMQVLREHREGRAA